MSRSSKTQPIDQPQSTWREVLWLASNTRQFKGAIPILIVLGLAAAAAEAVGVGLAVIFLFAFLGERDSVVENGGLLADVMVRVESVIGTNTTLIAVILFFMIVAKALLVFANSVVTAKLLNDIARKVRDQIHRNYVTVGYVFLQKKDHGDLLNSLSKESWAVAEAMYSLSKIGVHLCAVVIFSLGIFSLSSVVALTSFIAACVIFLLLRLMSTPVQKLGQLTLLANQFLADRMLLSLNAMRTIRVFATEDRVLSDFDEVSERVSSLAIRTDRWKALLGPVAEVAALGTLIIVAVVATRSGVDVPTLIACALLLFRLQPHLYQIEANRLILAGIRASLYSVRQQLETNDKPWPIDGSQIVNKPIRQISFTNVSFWHDPERGPSVKDLTFQIPAGKTTMISGPSGSGKTTILNLLLRLYDPDEGMIAVDDQNLSELKRKSWLSRLAISGQDVELLPATLAQNLRLGRPSATDEELRAVCEMVEIFDDIAELPDGFETRVGASGLNFSGGQRQRLGLARALICNPEILILDEAMSALEPDLEDRIRKRIKEKNRQATIIVVSHRRDAGIGIDHFVQIAKGQLENLISQPN